MPQIKLEDNLSIGLYPAVWRNTVILHDFSGLPLVQANGFKRIMEYLDSDIITGTFADIAGNLYDVKIIKYLTEISMVYEYQYIIEERKNVKIWYFEDLNQFIDWFN